MTKEEYQNLLDSDYWKGFSYSIIKERNFTCQDCGAYFPGERNMLQVHHLVYRDIMPWSYRPEEMVVLCRTCHARRHGIAPQPLPNNQPKQMSLNKEEGHYTKTYKPQKYNNRRKPKVRYFHSKSSGSIKTKLFWGILFLVALIWVLTGLKESPNHNGYQARKVQENKYLPERNTKKSASHKTAAKKKSGASVCTESTMSTPVIEAVAEPVSSDSEAAEFTDVVEITEPAEETPMHNALPEGEARSAKDIEHQLERSFWNEMAHAAGVSAEGSIRDIRRRIDQDFWKQEAQAEGVSADGSARDIQNRLIRRFWENRARAEGVSTEGSLKRIQLRLCHKLSNDQTK